jgi:hypothetical protein
MNTTATQNSPSTMLERASDPIPSSDDAFAQFCDNGDIFEQ